MLMVNNKIVCLPNFSRRLGFGFAFGESLMQFRQEAKSFVHDMGDDCGVSRARCLASLCKYSYRF